MSLQSTLLFLLPKAFQKPYAAATADDSGHTKRLDLDSATGFEVSAAIHGGGVSIDAQYNSFDAELLDAGITDLRSGSQACLHKKRGRARALQKSKLCKIAIVTLG